MEETRCKVCGYEGGAGETQCPECGAPLHKTVSAPAPAAQEPLDLSPAPAGEGTEGPLKKVYITLKAWAEKRRPLAWAAVFLTLCLLVQGLGLWSLDRGGPGRFFSAGPGWSAALGRGLITPQGVWKTRDLFLSPSPASQGGRQVLRSMDSVLSSSFPENVRESCYYYDGATLTETDWTQGTLSADGSVLFYTREEGAELVLYRRDLKRGREEELDRLPGASAGRLRASYDGSALLYQVAVGAGGRLRQWTRETGATELDYGQDQSTLALGVSREGERALIFSSGQSWLWGRGWEGWSLPQTALLLDRDLTQVLYQDAGGVMHYRLWTGEEGALDKAVTPLFPQGTLTYISGYITAMDRLTHWIYQGADSHLYYLDETWTLTDLNPESGVSGAVIDAQGRRLFYLGAGGRLMRVDRPLDPDRNRVELGERGLTDLNAAADLSLLCARDGEGWVLFDPEGVRTPLEHAHRAWPPCLLRNGVCWYLDGDGGVWFWSEEMGETPVMRWDSRLDCYMTLVGDGSQGLILFLNDTDTTGDYTIDYWVLEGDGSSRPLDALSLSDAP